SPSDGSCWRSPWHSSPLQTSHLSLRVAETGSWRSAWPSVPSRSALAPRFNGVVRRGTLRPPALFHLPKGGQRGRDYIEAVMQEDSMKRQHGSHAKSVGSGVALC